MSQYGFIGAGTMGGILARALHQTVVEEKICVSDVSASHAQALADQLNGQVADNGQIAAECTYIFLAVKPQVLESVLAELCPIFAQRSDSFVLVSMAAGTDISTVRRYAGGDYPVIRIMPNTPAAVGEGMILYTADGVSDAQLTSFLQAMQRAGRLAPIDEKLIDAASAVSGCGPAFVYLFIEALADGAVRCGLPRAAAMEYAAQTLVGSARMVLESGQHPGKLKDDVCSPGGSTIAGVCALENRAFRAAAAEAVCAAYERTLQLGKPKG